MLAAIPYETFPTVEVGPLHLRTFGLMVGLAVLFGAWVAGTYGRRWGVPADDTYRLATRMVLAGVIGARLSWAATHRDSIETPLDVIAVWEGGLQFSGGFLLAVVVGYPTFRTWGRLLRWRLLDGDAVGLALGVAIGRVGCIAVGEHFGRPSSFFLATRWEGGVPAEVREPTLGLEPGARAVTDGLTFHNTAVYELLAMVVLFVALVALMRRRPVPGTVSGTFLLGYAVSRFGLDALRVNDERTAGLTGAQWMCVAIAPIALWVLTWVRHDNARRAVDDVPSSPPGGRADPRPASPVESADTA